MNADREQMNGFRRFPGIIARDEAPCGITGVA